MHVPHACCSPAGSRGSKGAAGKRSLFLLYMDAVSIVNQRAANGMSKGADQLSQPLDHLPAHQATSFTLRDLHFIIKFAQVISPALQVFATPNHPQVTHHDACAQSFLALHYSSCNSCAL